MVRDLPADSAVCDAVATTTAARAVCASSIHPASRRVAPRRMRRLQEDLCKPPAGAENCDRLKIDGISRVPNARAYARSRVYIHHGDRGNEKQGDAGKWSPAAHLQITRPRNKSRSSRAWVRVLFLFSNSTDKTDGGSSVDEFALRSKIF